MIGIVLAAGESTRLPHKALLPSEHGTVIEENLGLLEDVCTEIHVTYTDLSIIPMFLEARGWKNLHFIRQDFHDGFAYALCDAIHTIGNQHAKYCILACDNIFPKGEKIETGLTPTACVREINSEEAQHLDRWNPVTQRWMDRKDASKDSVYLSFTLPLVIEWKHTTLACSHEPTADFLNRIKAIPIKKAHIGWHDIGTIESYITYLKELH
jgi:hypothetical protein